jgi:hypothetical protein
MILSKEETGWGKEWEGRRDALEVFENCADGGDLESIQSEVR